MRELHRRRTRAAGTEVRRGFEEAMQAASAVVVSGADETRYDTIISQGREALIVNRATPDGSVWTAVAALRQGQSTIRVRFITGNEPQSSLLELPMPSPMNRLEELRPTISKLVLRAPRRLARRLGFAGMLLDRLIQGAWFQGVTIRLSPGEYRQFEEFMIAAEDAEAPVS